MQSKVNVVCALIAYRTDTEPECNTTNVRLVDGPSPLNGRVEVCVDERWSTVCDNHWDNSDAAVVCKNLISDLFSGKMRFIMYKKLVKFKLQLISSTYLHLHYCQSICIHWTFSTNPVNTDTKMSFYISC